MSGEKEKSFTAFEMTVCVVWRPPIEDPGQSSVPAKPTIPRRNLHCSPEDGVEEELEGAFGLGAVLDAEAEHYDLPLSFDKTDGGGFALEAFGAVRVAGD